MRWLFSAILLGTLVIGAGTALAQDAAPPQGEEQQAGAEQVPTRFYDFNEMLIDGEFMRPEGMFTRARDRARFQRLLNLRREFLSEIEQSAKEEALQ
ncbi:MAG: hypothetical protein JW797_14440 [Bradymonadales bacterium]|nr:hypothetical protein [Bradymonadales bacterium]